MCPWPSPLPAVERIAGAAVKTDVVTGTEIALLRCTTSWCATLAAASYGISTLICVLETYNSGNCAPPESTTLVVDNSVGSGKLEFCAGASASPDPKMETSNPSAGALE